MKLTEQEHIDNEEKKGMILFLTVLVVACACSFIVGFLIGAMR